MMLFDILLVQAEVEEGYGQKRETCRADQAAQLCLEIGR